MPTVNQFELHPEHQNKDVVDVCEKSYIQPVAWGALNQGRIFKNQTFINLAKKYDVTPSQIAIRWSYQKGYCPLARSIKKEHIKANFDIQNFEITSEDMKILDNLDGGEWSNTHDDSVCQTIYTSTKQLKKDDRKVYIYKLFSVIPFVKRIEYGTSKTKWFLFGVPILKITQKKQKQ